MTGRLVALGLFIAAICTVGVGAIVPACYTPPEPACGFVCGMSTPTPCPDDYTCFDLKAGGDGRCHLNGTPLVSCITVDAGILLIDGPPEPPPDGPPDTPDFDDAPDPDAAPIPDAMVDAAMPDAIPDAMPDAPPVDSAPLDDAATD